LRHFDPIPALVPKGQAVVVEHLAAARNPNPDNCPRVGYALRQHFLSRALVPKEQARLVEHPAAARNPTPDNYPRVGY